jgi:hypothetical protein
VVGEAKGKLMQCQMSQTAKKISLSLLLEEYIREITERFLNLVSKCELANEH